MKKIFGSIFIAMLLLLVSCGKQEGDAGLEEYHKRESFSVDLKSPLAQRIGRAPDFVLNYAKDLDQNDRYRGRVLDEESKMKASRAMASLPAYLTRTLRQRLLGIYFIEGLAGSGFTEWAADGNGTIYSFMVFNPRIMKMSASELLTWRENTAFSAGNRGPAVSIACGKDLDGFLYILLHEALHVYDYAYGVTPWCDEGIKKFQGISSDSSAYTDGIWCGYSSPCKKLWFAGKVGFYGLGGKAPLSRSKAIAAYDALSGSPFVSLYGTLSWAEDFAEAGSFYHLTEVLGAEYRIDVLTDGKTVRSYRPCGFPGVKNRFPRIRELYDKKE